VEILLDEKMILHEESNDQYLWPGTGAGDEDAV
jgi:hypothetical protein